MPSTNTLTSFYTFTPSTLIKSAEMNSNFQGIRGHFIPIDTTTTAAAPAFTYDLGGYGHEWRGIYGQYLTIYGNTAGSVPALPTTTAVHIYAKSDGKVYKKTSAGETEIGAGGGVLSPTGSFAAPSTVTAAGGISWTSTSGDRQVFYVIGDTTTGTDVTANPQSTNGTTLGQELIVWNTDPTRLVKLQNGTGLELPGDWEGTMLHLIWNGTATGWSELYRRA